MTQPANLEAGATHQVTDKEATKVAIGALVGTAMEWYDFFLFSAAAALIFNIHYFTNENLAAASGPLPDEAMRRRIAGHLGAL